MFTYIFQILDIKDMRIREGQISFLEQVNFDKYSETRISYHLNASKCYRSLSHENIPINFRQHGWKTSPFFRLKNTEAGN